MIKLVVVDGPDLGREFTLTGEIIVIGRSNQCNLMLHDAALGRRHCEIRREGDVFILVDLTSVNGTYLNEQTARITSETLYHEDEIRLGKSRLRVELPGHAKRTDPLVPLTDEELPPPQLPTLSNPVTTSLPPSTPPIENYETGTPANELPLNSVFTDSSPPRLSLRVIEGTDTGKVFEMPSGVVRFTIGRGEAADWVLNDRQISRIHTTIEFSPAGFVLIDEGSRNGTFLRGETERIQRLPLHGGEEILLGETYIQVAILTETGTLVAPSLALPTWHISLRVVAGNDSGKIIEPGAKTQHFTIGRDNNADFVIDDRRISRVHVTIELTPTGFVLIDNNSRNGTFLKGQTQRVQRLPLRGNEEIQIGETVLLIEITEPIEGTLVAPPSYSSFQRPSAQRALDQVSSAEQTSLPLQQTFKPLPQSWIALGSSFLTLLCCLLLVWFGNPTLWSSAAISASHTQWEDSCSTCHSPWGRQPMSTTCGAVDCHANDLQETAQTNDRCEQCHTEHRGRRFAIRGDASQCWQCHASGFQDRPVWRYYRAVYRANTESTPTSYRLVLPASEDELLSWKNSAPHQETGLIFAHAAHASVSKQKECLTCHQPLPGTVINALGAVSAFPSHDACVECHSEVGDRDPQVAQQNSSTRCQMCHTHEDGHITRVQRTLAFVRFSHDNHKTTDCDTCHFTIKEELTYRPVIRSAAYALPMEACVSCHQQEHVTTSCIACHRTHHRMTAQSATAGTKGGVVSLGGILLFILALEIGGGVVLYMQASPSSPIDERR